MRLRGGFQTEDPRLDRLPQFDARSRNYPIRQLLDPRTLEAGPRSYTWACAYWLDQGQEGACVGFSITHEAGARPAVWEVNSSLALDLYHRAQQIDDWPGEAYEGTSVLAGTKAATERGWYSEYRWAFGVDDLALAVSRHGPAVIGIWWHSSMFSPDSTGLVKLNGNKAGGHAILVRGYNNKTRRFRLRNSWGRDWGLVGDCLIDYEDMATLLSDDGEAMVPVRRLSV